MKFIAILLLVACMQVSAGVKSQTVTYKAKDISLTEIFSVIKSQTGYVFFYSYSSLKEAKPITIDVKNEALQNVLDICFKDQPFTYLIKGRTIVVKEKPAPVTMFQEQEDRDLSDTLHSVLGKIRNEKGEPMPNVSIVIKGASIGTTSNLQGNYSINVSGKDVVLVFSYIGYLTQEVRVGTRTSVDILLKPDEKAQEEIVVVGYGVQKKVNQTGSVASLHPKAISGMPVPNTLNLLQGQLSGVQITVPGGQPGADQGMIRIRGAGSIGTDINNASKNNPLIIIDGVQSDLRDLGNLNPTDIASLSVLKDAASSAIYGSRAAGGVILVTTRSGEKGKARVTLNTLYGIQQAVVLPQFVDSWDYAILKNESRRNAGQTDFFTQEEIDGLKAGNDPDKYANTYWLDSLFSNAPMSKYDLSVSGGTENISYLVAGGYLQQDGILLNQKASLTNLRSSINVNITNRLKIGLNVWGAQNIAKQAYDPIEETMRRAYFAQPLVPVKWVKGVAAGQYTGNTDLGQGNPKGVQNPIQHALLGYRKNVNNRINLQFNGTIEIMRGLKYNLLTAYKNVSGREEAYQPAWENFRYNGVRSLGNDINYLQADYSNTDQFQIDNLLTYEKLISKDHQLNVLLGQSALSANTLSNSASVQNLPGTLQILDVGVSNPIVGGSKSKYTLQSFFGRLNYGWKSRYLFEANFRYDGSSRFPDNRKYGLFPSFSGAWKITEEAFMKDLQFVSNLKLRGSWGVLGNQNIGNYPHAQTLNLQQTYLDANGNVVSGAAITSLANDILRWEETTVIDFGLDLALWQGKIDVTVDYFKKITDGILTTLPLPLSLGRVGPPYQNAAKVLNKGWEYAITYRDNIGKLNYQLSTNLGTLYNEVTDFNGQERIIDLWIIREGEQINSFYGLEATGIFQTPEEVTKHAFQTSTTSPGDLKFRDVNSDGIIDDNDRVVIGHMIPKYSYGFAVRLNYQGFDLSALFQGIAGAVNYANGFGNDALRNPRATTIVDWLNRWTPENPSTKFIRVRWEDGNNSVNNSYWLRNGDYLRLKNVQIGYTFTQRSITNTGLNSARVYFSGQNLLTFTKVRHWDPEQFPSVINMQLHPQTKVFAVGLTVNF